MKKKMQGFALGFGIAGLTLVLLDWMRVVYRLPYGIKTFVQLMNIPYDGLLHLLSVSFGRNGGTLSLWELFVQEYLPYYAGYVLSYLLSGVLIGAAVGKWKSCAKQNTNG